jgi:hypothetical protein
VLVVEKVELVEGRARHLPVVLLVQVPEGERVGQDLVQVLDALPGGVLGERDRQPGDVAEGLDLVRRLRDERAGAVSRRRCFLRCSCSCSFSY